VEVEYEGDHDFLKQDLPKLLEAVVELRQKATDLDEDDPDDAEKKEKKNRKGAIQGTVAALAAKLGAKSGPDLIIAAAAKLTLVDQQSTFSRDELLKAMKTASNYYRKTYNNNLSKYLKVLLNGRLTETSTDNYALTATELDKLRPKLA
jgi:hypothetical protein